MVSPLFSQLIVDFRANGDEAESTYFRPGPGASFCYSLHKVPLPGLWLAQAPAFQWVLDSYLQRLEAMPILSHPCKLQVGLTGPASPGLHQRSPKLCSFNSGAGFPTSSSPGLKLSSLHPPRPSEKMISFPQAPCWGLWRSIICQGLRGHHVTWVLDG